MLAWKEYDTAVSWYEKALAAPEQSGSTGRTLYNMALAYYMKGDREGVRKYQKKAKSKGYPGSQKFEARPYF